MNDELKLPSLTLTPDIGGGADAMSVSESIVVLKKDDPAPLAEADKLTEEEKKLVEDFAAQIDLTNSGQVLMYGASAQKNVAAFADSALQGVRTKDMGDVGGMLTGLVVELKNFNASAADDKSKLKGLFKSAKRNIDKMKASYSKVEVNVEAVSASLKNHQKLLLKDIAMLDRLFEENKNYFKEITLYIAAGEKKLAETRETVLKELQEKAAASGEMSDAQQANDLSAMCDRFEKKIHDLKLTKQISIQMAPQIRLLQNNDAILVEKIQSTIVNTIPLWKNQMVMALGMSNAQNAMKAQREVTDLTNEMLKKNAEALKLGTVEIARESERGIVDIETLKQTNQSLISTFDEVVKIQEDGRSKRKNADEELSKLELELKNKLLEMRK